MSFLKLIGDNIDQGLIPVFPAELSVAAGRQFDDLTRTRGIDTLTGQGPNDWPNTFRSSRFIPAVEYIRAQRARRLLMQQMDELMTRYDAFVSPAPGSGSLTITNLTGKFFSEGTGWLLAFIAIAVVVGTGVNELIQRRRAGLPLGDPWGLIIKSTAVAAAVLGAVWVLNDDRGVPRSAVILVLLCAIMAFLTTRTTWGRHLYAVGGNEEAARRAGINTTWVKMSVFILASTFAAAGGVLAASRLLAVNQTSGGSDLLLFAIAGPVVAGVSLFGGRGTVWAALLGALVIGSIQNGMDLLALQSQDKYMITGAVLLLAITFDALTSKRRAAGRR